jgi:hypothetical protein
MPHLVARAILTLEWAHDSHHTAECCRRRHSLLQGRSNKCAAVTPRPLMITPNLCPPRSPFRKTFVEITDIVQRLMQLSTWWSIQYAATALSPADAASSRSSEHLCRSAQLTFTPSGSLRTWLPRVAASFGSIKGTLTKWSSGRWYFVTLSPRLSCLSRGRTKSGQTAEQNDPLLIHG